MLYIVNKRKDSFTPEAAIGRLVAQNYSRDGVRTVDKRDLSKSVPRAAEDAAARAPTSTSRLSPRQSASTARRCRSCCPAPRRGCRAPKRCSTSPPSTRCRSTGCWASARTRALTGEIRESLEIEEAPDGFDRTLLARWHAEAAGTKIRYVPAGIPDLLRTEALIDYEADISNTQPRGAGRRDAVPHRLQPPAGDRHGGLHAAPHAGDLCARPRRLGSLSRPAPAAEQLAHMATPARRSLPDLPPVPL